MKLVELFCGCGGFSLGAHRAGFTVAAAYDVDEILTSSYPSNFPGTNLHHLDVAQLTGAQVVADVGAPVFGIFGGPPCQGFSDIGKRQRDDPRRELLGHFFRIVSEVRPEFFVMENVRGLAYRDARPVLDEAMKLVENDYDILGPHIWNAAEFGAATTRNRMFVIGVRKAHDRPIRIGDVECRKRKPANVRQAIADLRGAEPLGEFEALAGYDRWQIRRKGLPSVYARMLRSEDMTFTGHRPTMHSDAVINRFRSVEPGEADRIGRHPRLQWTGQCPTLRAGTGSDRGSFQSVRPIHPVEHRVITVREAARLQGFPDAHVFHPTIWHSFRMIGNSVSPIMGEAIFGAIHDRLSLDQSNPFEVESAKLDVCESQFELGAAK
jgi:DNA (cytosine-5)-methyltransferase 1